MKLKVILILGLVVLGTAVYGFFKATPGADNQENLPKIEITPSSFNFGEIEFGKIVEYAFRVKNTGSEVLEIKRVATSCACTIARVNKETLEPGQETELKVKYDTAAMGDGSHGRGKQERIIYVKSSDPLKPQTEVMIYANVK